MKPIASADNPGFKRWLRLAESGRDVRSQRTTLAEGLHLAEAVHTSGCPVMAVLVRRGTRNDEVHRWASVFVSAGANGFELAAALFDRLAPVERGAGLLLQIDFPQPASLAVADSLLLDGVQDPGNAGALLRVAAAAGVRNIVATPGTVALWSPKVLRGGQGAHFRLHIMEEVAVPAVRVMLPMPWFGAAAHAGAALWSTDLAAPVIGLAVGSEGGGLTPEAVALCDRLLTIPLATGVESLNVTAAAAICLFERRRQVGAAAQARPLRSA
jgi:TrmH family RNA methyltransferase